MRLLGSVIGSIWYLPLAEAEFPDDLLGRVGFGITSDPISNTWGRSFEKRILGKYIIINSFETRAIK
jgi:hypothetical protein